MSSSISLKNPTRTNLIPTLYNFLTLFHFSETNLCVLITDYIHNFWIFCSLDCRQLLDLWKSYMFLQLKRRVTSSYKTSIGMQVLRNVSGRLCSEIWPITRHVRGRLLIHRCFLFVEKIIWKTTRRTKPKGRWWKWSLQIGYNLINEKIILQEDLVELFMYNQIHFHYYTFLHNNRTKFMHNEFAETWRTRWTGVFLCDQHTGSWNDDV